MALLTAALDLSATRAPKTAESEELATSELRDERELASPPRSGLSRAVVQDPEPLPDQPAEGAAASSAAAEKPGSAKSAESHNQALEQKYAGATLDQLLAAESVLEERRNVDRDRILKELVDANRLVELPRAPDGLASVPGNKDGSPVSSIMTWEQVDGVTVAKAAVISGEEFPEYRALELEVWWLQCKVHALKKEARSRVSQVK